MDFPELKVELLKIDRVKSAELSDNGLELVVKYTKWCPEKEKHDAIEDMQVRVAKAVSGAGLSIVYINYQSVV